MVPTDRPVTRPVGRLFALAALVLMFVVMMQSPAAAHASVTDIVPEADSVLGSAPELVSITFSEPVSGTGHAIRVFDPSGRQLDGIEATSRDRSVAAELPNLTKVGSYTVAWRVVSADGHPINGAFLFSVGKATLTQPLDVAVDGESPSASKAVRIVGSLIAWAGLAIALAFVGLAARSRQRRGLIHAAIGATVVGSGLAVVGALLAVDGTIGDALRVTWNTTSGKLTFAAFVVSLVTAVVVVAATRLNERLHDGHRRLVMALLSLTVVVLALEGHAVAVSPVSLSAPLTVLHVVAAISWLAGLVWIDRRSQLVTVDELRADVAARSPFAMVVVAVLAVTGITLLVTRISLDDLTGSAYGIIGSIKIVVLAMALVLAWQNRTTMKARSSEAGPSGAPVEDSASGDATAGSATGRDDSDAALEKSHHDIVDLRRFRSSLRAETILVSVALILGVLLAQTPPPGDSSGGPAFFSGRQPFGNGQVELTIDPPRRGVAEIHVTALDRDGRLMSTVSDLKIGFMLPAKDFGPLEPSLQVISAGHSYTFARIPFGGDWKVIVTATFNRFEELRATFDVPIRD